jgi:hypothetical protein
MRRVSEFVSVVLAGFAAFFGGILLMLGFVVLWICGLVSSLFLMVSAFAGIMYMAFGTHHAAVIAVVYLGYAAVPFVAIFVSSYYYQKLIEPPQQGRASPDISGLQVRH